MNQSSVQQMRRYDPEIIRRYYRNRPWRAVWRAFTTVRLFAGLLLGLKWDDWLGHCDLGHHHRAIQLRQILTQLGPTYIKVGQALSTRPDLVRKDFLDELIKLQDQLPPFPTEIARAIIEQELDREIEELYSEFSAEPVAAASLGQVYQGRLHTGEAVAIKVQRPGLLSILTLDLYLLRWGAGLVDALGCR